MTSEKGDKEMNVISKMTIKRYSDYLTSELTLREAAERLSGNALPVVGECGQYLGIANEHILLWALRTGANWDTLLAEIADDFPRPYATAAMDTEEVTDIVTEYGFVPVTDDRHVYIGSMLR